MQSEQPAPMSAMADAVNEQLLDSLKIEEVDRKIEYLERPSEVEELPELDREGGADNEDEEEEEFEFSFPCGNPGGSPIAAEDAFQNGQIRPIFPFFDQSLLLPDEEAAAGSSPSIHQPLRKLFTEGGRVVSASTKGEPETERSPWEDRTVVEIKSPAPRALCQKSNSTGSSRLWRFRDLVRRSSSDGKDAFVFLNPTPAAEDERRDGKKKATKEGEEKKAVAVAAAKGKKAAAAKAGAGTGTAPPSFYGRGRAAAEKRRSYLPYRPGLVGFFTNVNGLSKNVHPF